MLIKLLIVPSLFILFLIGESKSTEVEGEVGQPYLDLGSHQRLNTGPQEERETARAVLGNQNLNNEELEILAHLGNQNLNNLEVAAGDTHRFDRYVYRGTLLAIALGLGAYGIFYSHYCDVDDIACMIRRNGAYSGSRFALAFFGISLF